MPDASLQTKDKSSKLPVHRTSSGNMTASQAYPPELAFNVCVRCKGRKKKCDKVLPSCARCTRLQVRCQYGTLELSQLPTPPDTASVGTSEAPVYDKPFPGVVASYTFLSPQTGSNMLPKGHQISSIDDQLTKQAYDIITRQVYDIPLSLSRYFSSVHGWFPIVREAEVREQISHLHQIPNADFAILVLIIHLVSHMYEEENAHTINSRDQFYQSVKGLYSITTSSKASSMELIQAGILLALYEHCQALHDATYQTLGACARMGYSLGFHQSICPSATSDTESSSVIEKRRHVWWGIIILERISMLEYLHKKLPFAIPEPRPGDLLPSDNGTIHPVSDGIIVYGKRTITRAGKIGGYGRLAQSSALLGHVLSHIVASTTKSSSCGAARLDNGLRSFAMTLLQPDEAEYLHSAYSICLSALLTLNRFEISAEPIPEEAHEKELFQARAKLGFQSVLRMIFESIVACSLLPKSASHSAPIWTLHSISGAVLLRLELGPTQGNEEEWPARLSGLKGMLGSLSSQWKLAEQYLKTIEAAEARGPIPIVSSSKF